MDATSAIDYFLASYSDQVVANCLLLRELLLNKLPGITEQVDGPAKMIAYCYGQQYADLICVIIPSKKGVKLGFNRGVDLEDPDKLLQGKGKISRYVPIKSSEQITSPSLVGLITAALELYKRMHREKGKHRV